MGCGSVGSKLRFKSEAPAIRKASSAWASVTSWPAGSLLTQHVPPPETGGAAGQLHYYFSALKPLLAFDPFGRLLARAPCVYFRQAFNLSHCTPSMSRTVLDHPQPTVFESYPLIFFPVRHTITPQTLKILAYNGTASGYKEEIG